MTDVILDTLREEAKLYAEEHLNFGGGELTTKIQSVFVEGYVAGGASVLKKELADRLYAKYNTEKDKKKHKKTLKTAYKKVPAK